MRFRSSPETELPTIDLVPMMDVLMSVLTFFVISSLSLTGQRLAGIQPPSVDAESASGSLSQVTQTEQLLVGLKPDGQITIQNQDVSSEEMKRQVTAFLVADPQGEVILMADQNLEYIKIENFLKEMEGLGRDRIFLFIP